MRRVILLHTRGPRNAGAALRAVANFGPAELMFVAPDRPSLLVHPEFEQMAHGVEDVAGKVRVVDTIQEALADCHMAVAFTARVRDHRRREDWREVEPDVHPIAASEEQRLALVFGSEESGLTAEATDLCQRLCLLATSGEHTSINLALSVGIVLSSLFRGDGRHKVEPGPALADGNMREFIKRHAKEVFANIAQTDSAAEGIERSIDRLFSYSELENRDVRVWQLMLRALGSQKGPLDFGLPGRAPKARRRQAQEQARKKRESEE